MNNRTRQWIKASVMLDKYDPTMIATIQTNVTVEKTIGRTILIFRRSSYEKYKQLYGDDLKVIDVGDV